METIGETIGRATGFSYLASLLLLSAAGCAPNLGGPPNPDMNKTSVDMRQPNPDSRVRVDMRVLTPDHSVRKADMPIVRRIDSRIADMARTTTDGAVTGASCDPVMQSCTSTSMPKCAVTIPSGAATASCTTNGTVALGGSCSIPTKQFGVDDCAKGGVCWVVTPPPSGGTPMGTCQKYCGADANCGSGALCDNEFGTTYGLCLSTCKIGGTCPSGASCNWDLDMDGSTLTLDCQTYGTGMTGTSCNLNNFNSDCAANTACLPTATDAGTAGFCYALCVPGGSPGCPSSQTCHPLGTSTTIGACY